METTSTVWLVSPLHEIIMERYIFGITGAACSELRYGHLIIYASLETLQNSKNSGDRRHKGLD